ncbi:MAG: ATPase, T2SS/T4P/T4SS family [Planctomycetota bacterium]|jgi:excisionase family DNA binding protein
MSNQETLGAAEVREALGISRATLYRWVRSGKLTGVRVGGRWRFPRAAVDEALGAEDPSRAALEEARRVCLGRLEALGRTESADPSEQVAEAVAELIVSHALARRATDVHLEPVAGGLRVRERVDGVLVELSPHLPAAAAEPVTRAVKAFAEMDPHEASVSQRGRFFTDFDGRKIDVRAFTFPTGLGDSARLCLLDPAAVAESLDDAGFDAALVTGIRSAVRRSTGVFLVNGLTDSGKTTTHYLILKELTRPGVKIMTVEDPVEIHLDGVLQANVTPEMDFRRTMLAMTASGLDVGLVSELRDGETMRLLFQVASTGHLMLSTLHAPDAFTAIHRILVVGQVAPRTVVESLRGVLDQRLLPASCTGCRTTRRIGKEEADLLGLPAALRRKRLAANDGCETCGGTGVLGRSVVGSLLVPGAGLHEAIESGVTDPEGLRDAAPEGYRPLLDAVHGKIAAGEVAPAVAIEALGL